MTNLVILSIQLVTNDVSKYELIPFTDGTNTYYNWNSNRLNAKKEVWQVYTIGYQDMEGRRIHDFIPRPNEPGTPVVMLTLSNLFGTLEPKQETNWVFNPSK